MKRWKKQILLTRIYILQRWVSNSNLIRHLFRSLGDPSKAFGSRLWIKAVNFGKDCIVAQPGSYPMQSQPTFPTFFNSPHQALICSTNEEVRLIKHQQSASASEKWPKECSPNCCLIMTFCLLSLKFLCRISTSFGQTARPYYCYPPFGAAMLQRGEHRNRKVKFVNY